VLSTSAAVHLIGRVEKDLQGMHSCSLLELYHDSFLPSAPGMCIAVPSIDKG
jgi:hypothetical protein